MRVRAGFGLTMIAAGCALGAAGCAWRPFVPSDAPSRVPLMAQPMATSMGQMRDPSTGAVYFVPCNPCSQPTPKTAAVGLPERPLVPVQGARPAVATGSPMPAPASVQVPAGTVREARSAVFEKQAVYFNYASVRLSRSDRLALLALAKTIPAGRTVLVTGMADKSGTVSKNRRIAALRAAAVRAVLIEGGVSPSSVLTTHCLECASNDAPRLARRAEITLQEP